jgi:HEAT repeat protein
MTAVLSLEPLRNGVLVLAGAVLLLTGMLLCKRVLAFLRESHIRRREPALIRLIYGAVQSTPVTLTPFENLRRRDRNLVRSILLGLALDLRGDTGEAISQLYIQLGLLRVDLQRLRSWRASTRAEAAADLGLIRSSEAAPALLKALHDDDVRVRQAAVWAIGQTGSPENLRLLVRLLGDRSLAVAHRAQEVLAERGREIPDAIVVYAETTSSRVGRLVAIELIGWLHLTGAGDLLVRFAADLDSEIRVKSVKAAAAIGDPRFIDVFHARLEDTSWPVRCQAAKGLSLFGSPESVPHLSKALRDRQWWVRLYAATALAEVGPAGEEALADALKDQEPGVREMARYLVERGDLVPVLP